MYTTKVPNIVTVLLVTVGDDLILTDDIGGLVCVSDREGVF